MRRFVRYHPVTVTSNVSEEHSAPVFRAGNSMIFRNFGIYLQVHTALLRSIKLRLHLGLHLHVLLTL
jgi:hypothetical protein